MAAYFPAEYPLCAHKEGPVFVSAQVECDDIPGNRLARRRRAGAAVPACAAGRSRKGRRRRHAACCSSRIRPGAISQQEPLPALSPLLAISLEDPYPRKCGRNARLFPGKRASISRSSPAITPPPSPPSPRRPVCPHAERYIDMSSVRTSEALAEAANEYTVVRPRLARPEKGPRQGHAGQGPQRRDDRRRRQRHFGAARGRLQHRGSPKAATRPARCRSSCCSIPISQNCRTFWPRGRRVVNNITRVAGIFFVKTIYSVLHCRFCAWC